MDPDAALWTVVGFYKLEQTDVKAIWSGALHCAKQSRSRRHKMPEMWSSAKCRGCDWSSAKGARGVTRETPIICLIQ